MQRRQLIATSVASAAVPSRVWSQALEKPQLSIAVGGKNLFYYLPLTIAEQLGYFKAEGLDVTIVDFSGGARALQAVVGGSADVVSGACEHTAARPMGHRLRQVTSGPVRTRSFERSLPIDLTQAGRPESVYRGFGAGRRQPDRVGSASARRNHGDTSNEQRFV